MRRIDCHFWYNSVEIAETLVQSLQPPCHSEPHAVTGEHMNIHRMFSDRSDLYSRIRPQHPREIYDYLAEVTPCNGLAWDCACGNGQVALDLVKHFDRVEATDISREQISQAPSIDGVKFSVVESESTLFDDQIFDLVCVGQALHWFDYDRFWPELDRLLKPGGIFAAWGYNFPSMNPDIDEVLEETLYPVIKPYWSDRNRLLWNHYRDVAIPYRRLDAPHFTFSIEWDLAELLTYIHTWSAVRRCMDALGDSFYTEACERVRKLWGNESKRREIRMDFCFLATQKET